MTTSLIIIFCAGILNGAFSLPSKYISKWKFEHIWLQFSFWGFVLLPSATIYYLVPNIWHLYSQIPNNLLLLIIIGGFFYGIGQICFVKSLDSIGVGLSFAINIGVSIVLGFSLPLFIQHPDKIFTGFGLAAIIGAILATIGLCISYYAGILRDRDNLIINLPKFSPAKSHSFGLLLAIIAGISSASQNLVFSFTRSIETLALQTGTGHFAAANIIWPMYLLSGFVPYMAYMLYLHFKNNSFTYYLQKGNAKYYFYTLLMAMLSYGSLCLYTKGSQLIGPLGPVIGWQLFMSSIILSSTFWGWVYGEWKDCSMKAKNTMKLGLVFFIMAIIILGYSSTHI